MKVMKVLTVLLAAGAIVVSYQYGLLDLTGGREAMAAEGKAPVIVKDKAAEKANTKAIREVLKKADLVVRGTVAGAAASAKRSNNVIDARLECTDILRGKESLARIRVIWWTDRDSKPTRFAGMKLGKDTSGIWCLKRHPGHGIRRDGQPTCYYTLQEYYDDDMLEAIQDIISDLDDGGVKPDKDPKEDPKKDPSKKDDKPVVKAAIGVNPFRLLGDKSSENYLKFAAQTARLIVIGKPKDIKALSKRTEGFELEIIKVLYGKDKRETVKVRYSWANQRKKEFAYKEGATGIWFLNSPMVAPSHTDPNEVAKPFKGYYYTIGYRSKDELKKIRELIKDRK